MIERNRPLMALVASNWGRAEQAADKSDRLQLGRTEQAADGSGRLQL